jgi:hypothetical protein
MARINVVQEQQAIDLAERLLDEIDRNLDAQGVPPSDPWGAKLKAMDADLRIWRKAARTGRYDRAALGAVLRTTIWTRALTDAKTRTLKNPGKRYEVTLR